MDRVYEVENVFGTNHDDILQGDDEDNVLMGYGGDDQLFTGKSGSDLLNGGNGSDTYSWIRAVKSFTSAFDSTMIVDSYMQPMERLILSYMISRFKQGASLVLRSLVMT